VEKSRIPAEQSREFASWSLPDVEDGKAAKAAATAASRDPGNQIVARALTARQLEEITIQAQREGHSQGLREGRVQGVAQGLEEGRAAARQELAKQVEQLKSVAAQMLDPIAAQQDSIELALTQLALDIARAVVDQTPVISSADLLPIVRRAVRELPVGARNITVLLHPQQLELMRTCAEWPSNWQLQADGRVDLGGCKVLTEQSLVDFSVELRFRQVAAALLAESASDPIEPGTLLGDDDD
jgi:flagellar assembly protein FliH